VDDWLVGVVVSVKETVVGEGTLGTGHTSVVSEVYAHVTVLSPNDAVYVTLCDAKHGPDTVMFSPEIPTELLVCVDRARPPHPQTQPMRSGISVTAPLDPVTVIRMVVGRAESGTCE